MILLNVPETTALSYVSMWWPDMTPNGTLQRAMDRYGDSNLVQNRHNSLVMAGELTRFIRLESRQWQYIIRQKRFLWLQRSVSRVRRLHRWARAVLFELGHVISICIYATCTSYLWPCAKNRHTAIIRCPTEYATRDCIMHRWVSCSMLSGICAKSIFVVAATFTCTRP